MIALFTDFGQRDAYVAQIKGVILSINPQARLLDLNHDVGHFDIRAASYLLEISARYFPAGTIFVAVVDPGVGSARRPVIVQTQAEKLYVGPDNGLFTRVIQHEGVSAAFTLTVAAYFRTLQLSPTFHGRDVFAPVAAHLSLGVTPSQCGPLVADLVQLPTAAPQVDGAIVTGEVLHIDHFGNIITNIPGALLPAWIDTGLVTVTLASVTYTVPFVQTYASVAPQHFVCLRNSDDLFELAMNQGNAAAHVRAHAGAKVVLRPAVESA